jgi:hypothetical protein
MDGSTNEIQAEFVGFGHWGLAELSLDFGEQASQANLDRSAKRTYWVQREQAHKGLAFAGLLGQVPPRLLVLRGKPWPVLVQGVASMALVS